MSRICQCEKCGKWIKIENTIFSLIGAEIYICDECRKIRIEKLKLKEEQKLIDQSFNSAKGSERE